MKLSFLLLLVTIPVAALDLRQAQIEAPASSVAAAVLREEVQKRTGLDWQRGRVIIQLSRKASLPAEGYRIEVGADRVHVEAASERGLLYGVGALLRRLDWSPGQAKLPDGWKVESAPRSPLRGHQLGYRATANSWDAWSVAQYDQYIRDLVLFGVNAIENIPFQDDKPAPLMKLPRREMNREISRICRKYDIEYWVWLPADFDLTDQPKRAAFLRAFAEMEAESAGLAGVFVPGGDPGHNPPELVMPLLVDLARLSKARIWLSLQGFNREREDYVYQWIEAQRPKWLGGLVAGPSSPPVDRSRARLPSEYGIRLYTDITHNKICQHQVPNWDQAYALTLGREAINPRPAEMAGIHNRYKDWSIGFLTYSDGVHDDVNKIIFSALGWNPEQSPRQILIEYARLHFAVAQAAEIADAILALEVNWRGPLVYNGAVESTLATWQRLEQSLPALKANWRWQMCLLRAHYDAYVRRRLLRESALEEEANAVLLRPGQTSALAIAEASRILAGWPTAPALRARIEELCASLFESIGLQTSVSKYGASGTERGAVLDLVDYPLNNRFWLEDEFRKVSELPGEAARLVRLHEIATWEKPGAGSHYDDIGNEGRSPRVEMDERDEPMFWWLDQGMSRLRLSSQTTMWPKRVRYNGVDPQARYQVKTGGQGQSLLRINGERVEGSKQGDFYLFSVPASALATGKLELTWDIPTDESHLNWRQRSRLAEVWLLRRDQR